MKLKYYKSDWMYVVGALMVTLGNAVIQNIYLAIFSLGYAFVSAFIAFGIYNHKLEQVKAK